MRLATDFRETECCVFAVVQRAAQQKNDWMWRVLGVTVTFEKPTAISNHPKRGWGPHHQVEATVD